MTWMLSSDRFFYHEIKDSHKKSICHLAARGTEVWVPSFVGKISSHTQ